MSSLFHRWRKADPELLKLPSECVPGGETDTLRAKREAQLKWMRERGVRYLGNPMVWPDRRAPGSPIAPSRDLRAAEERPGDEIVRDLASNG
jgi:hypothetical protein